MAVAINSGKFEVVLPDWKVPEKELFIVYPSGENNSPRNIALLHALLKCMDMTKGIHIAATAKQFFQNSAPKAI